MSAVHLPITDLSPSIVKYAKEVFENAKKKRINAERAESTVTEMSFMASDSKTSPSEHILDLQRTEKEKKSKLEAEMAKYAGDHKKMCDVLSASFHSMKWPSHWKWYKNIRTREPVLINGECTKRNQFNTAYFKQTIEYLYRSNERDREQYSGVEYLAVGQWKVKSSSHIQDCKDHRNLIQIWPIHKTESNGEPLCEFRDELQVLHQMLFSRTSGKYDFGKMEKFVFNDHTLHEDRYPARDVQEMSNVYVYDSDELYDTAHAADNVNGQCETWLDLTSIALCFVVCLVVCICSNFVVATVAYIAGRRRSGK